MLMKLKVLIGKNAGQELAIPGPKFFIGRADDCHLRPRSELISRHHCVLLLEDDYAAVRDFGSRNGTLVNGERVVGERELNKGDQLTVGPLAFEVTQIVVDKKRARIESVKEAAARTVADHAHDKDQNDDEFDISQLLGDDSGVTATSETTVLNANETAKFFVNEDAAGTDSGAAVSQPPAAPPNSHDTPTSVSNPMAETRTDQQSKQAPKAPGKLPPIPRGSDADSGSAAADALSKFFKRR
jgi:pSer/pThr/pTyr-binding forkhead associated (FHA) protein